MKERERKNPQDLMDICFMSYLGGQLKTRLGCWTVRGKDVEIFNCTVSCFKNGLKTEMTGLNWS